MEILCKSFHKETREFSFPWKDLQNANKEYIHIYIPSNISCLYISMIIFREKKKDNFILRALRVISCYQKLQRKDKRQDKQRRVTRFPRASPIGKKLYLDFTYISLMTLTLLLLSSPLLSSFLPFSLRRMKAQQQIASLCKTVPTNRKRPRKSM